MFQGHIWSLHPSKSVTPNLFRFLETTTEWQITKKNVLRKHSRQIVRKRPQQLRTSAISKNGEKRQIRKNYSFH